MDVFQEFIASPAGLAAKAMLGLAFLEFIFGLTAALKDGTFDGAVVAAFVRKHILGRVFPIATLLAGGYFLNDGVILSGAIASAGVYTVETVSGLLGSIGQIRSTPSESAMVNEVPVE